MFRILTILAAVLTSLALLSTATNTYASPPENAPASIQQAPAKAL